MNMFLKRTTHSRGIALLEFALIFLVLSGFFIGVTALTVQYQESTTLEKLLAQTLSEPFGARYALDLEGKTPRIDKEKIQEFLRLKTDALSAELEALYGSQLSYTITTGFAEYAPGFYGGTPYLIDSQQSLLRQQGNVRLRESEQKNLNLSNHFRDLTHTGLNERHVLVPSSLYLSGQREHDPHARVIILGMAVALSRQSSLLSEFLSSLTGSVATTRVQLSYLRGAQL